jgi:hypothetical protein
MTGLIATLASIGAALLALQPLAAAFGVALTTALGPIAIAAAGIGLLAGAVAAYVVHTTNAKKPTEDLNQEIETAQERLTSYQNALANNVPYAVGAKNTEDLKSKIAELSSEVDEMTQKAIKASAHASSVSGADQQDAQKKAAADRRAKDLSARNAMELASVKDHDQSMLDELELHNAQVVKLEKEQGDVEAQLAMNKNADEKAALREKLDDIKNQLVIAKESEKEQDKTYNDEILNQDQYYQSLSADQKEQFAHDNLATLRQSLNTESQARQQAALQEAQLQVKNHNTFLQEQIKFGTAYATINKLMHSEIYDGTSKAFTDLSALQQSSNDTLKGIGKAAAVANIVIKTAESAMDIYAGFATIPIIGPALGIAGAAAAVAFGAEQIGTVTSAAQGGLITGGIPGIDSVPVLAQAGELVAPRQNYEEVVGSVAAKRMAEENGSGGQVEVIIGFRDDAFEIIEKKILQRRRIGVGVL